MFMGFHQAAIQAGKISIAVFPASGQLLDPPIGLTVLRRRIGRAANRAGCPLLARSRRYQGTETSPLPMVKRT